MALTINHTLVAGNPQNPRIDDNDWNAAHAVSGTVENAQVPESAVTQHQSAIDHDSLTNFVANEHINWTNTTQSFLTTGNVTIDDKALTINNPAKTFSYKISTSAITSQRIVTLPALQSDDSFIFSLHGTTSNPQPFKGVNQFITGSRCYYSDGTMFFGSPDTSGEVILERNASQSSDVTVEFPLMTSSAVLAVTTQSQTFTAAQTFNSGTNSTYSAIMDGTATAGNLNWIDFRASNVSQGSCVLTSNLFGFLGVNNIFFGTSVAAFIYVDAATNLISLSATSGISVSGNAQFINNATFAGLTTHNSGILVGGGNLDLNGIQLILDADGDTSITSDTDDQIDFRIGAVDDVVWTGTLASFNDAQSGQDFRISSDAKVDFLRAEVANDNLDLDGSQSYQEITTTPASPDNGSEVRMYMKDDKIIFQYNDAGTIRYKYLDLTGTGVTWVHTTTAP